MSFELKRPDTAFAVLRQKKPREKRNDHLGFIRELKCAVCLKSPVDPAHLRAGNRTLGKPHTGLGEKPHDRWTNPLCRAHHDEQHKAGDEVSWWRGYGIDPFVLAMSLYGCSGDYDTAIQIIVENAPKERTDAT